MRHSPDSAESHVAAPANDLRAANRNRIRLFWNRAFCAQAQELVLQDDHRAIVAYRGKDEVKRLRDERDCLRHFRRRVGEAALLEMDALDAVEAEVAALIDRAVATAQAAPLPPESALLTDVYASY